MLQHDGSKIRCKIFRNISFIFPKETEGKGNQTMEELEVTGGRTQTACVHLSQNFHKRKDLMTGCLSSNLLVLIITNTATQ